MQRRRLRLNGKATTAFNRTGKSGTVEKVREPGFRALGDGGDWDAANPSIWRVPLRAGCST